MPSTLSLFLLYLISFLGHSSCTWSFEFSQKACSISFSFFWSRQILHVSRTENENLAKIPVHVYLSGTSAKCFEIMFWSTQTSKNFTNIASGWALKAFKGLSGFPAKYSRRLLHEQTLPIETNSSTANCCLHSLVTTSRMNWMSEEDKPNQPQIKWKFSIQFSVL